MAKKQKLVVAVVGSGRHAGNSDVLCDRALAGARAAGAKTKKFYLGDMKITPCSGCDFCQRTREGLCAVHDDMEELYPLLRACDALVVATPIYFFTMSAQTKLFIDRLYPLTTPEGMQLGAKRAVVCMAYGAPDPLLAGVGNAAHIFNDIFTFAGIPMSFVHASAWQKGDVRKNRVALKRAFELGKEAVSPVARKS